MQDEASDTSAEARAVLIEGYRRMSPSDKLQRTAELSEMTRQLAIADVRRRYPDASDREVLMRAASRWLGPELMLRAFGWDVQVMGY